MKDIQYKNNPPKYSEEKDLHYQEIEKTTFLVESELKDFKELIYLNSSINKKYTALLYSDKEREYLYLFILRHIIDPIKENVSYKIKAKLILNKNDIDKTTSDEKQIFVEEQTNKNVKNEYKIMLINRDLILLEVTGKKLIVINFDKKEYGVLFSNTNDKKVITVVDTYDELIILKNKEKSDSINKKIYQIRTYIFCIATGVLYFFIINEKIFSDLQFLLIPFPFEEDIKDCIDFKILKIYNKSVEQRNSIKNKYYFMMIVLLNGKLVRYITDLNNKSLKEILLKFKENMNNNFIRKTIDKFDKGNNNNFNNYKLKIYRSEKCASFIILQIDFHVFTFKFYERDSPDDMIKRLGDFNDNNFTNIIEISNTNINDSSDINLNSNIKSSTRNIVDLGSETNVHTVNDKNPASNSLNESPSQSKKKLPEPRRHLSISNVNISSLMKSTYRLNSQISNNESMISNGNTLNSIDQQTDSFLTSTETKDATRDTSVNTLINNLNNINNNNISNIINRNSLRIKHSSSDKDLNIPELKTKDKEVVYYSLYKLNKLGQEKEKNNDNDNIKDIKDNNDIEKEKEKEENNETYKSVDEILKNIKYSFSFHCFITFMKTKNSVMVCYIPDKSKDGNDIEKVIKSNRKLSIKGDENCQILDILHYDQLKYSFLLTNNFIYKFRVNIDLLHLLNITKNISTKEEPKKESIYYKLNNIFKNSRTNKISITERCKLCRKPDSKIICPKCKRAKYCSLEHQEDDKRNIHFFQCEMYLCLSKLNTDRRKNDNLVDINNIIISFKNILNQIFSLIENKKDYINYSMYLKIMLNILEYIKVESFMNEVLSPMRSAFKNDYHQICDTIFIIELWFFYLNLNILYIDFIIKSQMYSLASKLVNKIKIVDLIENRESKLTTMFMYFSLPHELMKYNMYNDKDKIEQYSKKFFFDLLEIYYNGKKTGNKIHEQFFRNYLYSFCSLLKINLLLKEKSKIDKDIAPINIDKTVYHIPILFEEKFANVDPNSISNENQLKLPLIILYYYISFILVKIDKVPTAINLLRYILEEIKKINNKNDINNKINNDISNKYNVSYFALEAKIYLNIGILKTYNGDFNLGIHYLENCYRLCFEKKLSTILTMKVLNLLSLAYINFDKIDTAFILLKTGINLTKKFLTVKKNFNSTILIKKLSLFKLKLYLLFLYQYISYKYQKMNKILTTKTKGKNNIIKDPDDIPTSIFPTSFNKMSPALIGYICEEDKSIRLAEGMKEKINKEDETFKFELDSNLDKFVLFCNNWKFEMIIKALEFLYKLSDKEYEILNNDNGSIQKEEIKDDNYNFQKEKSSIINRDSSLSYSRSIINKEKINLNFKEDNENFFDEIEVKIGLYDKLSDLQQKELKSIQNNIFRRSILLRDPKGKIDKFNLNYHPKYTFDFYELFTKMSETIFLNQLEKFGIGEQYEAKIFEHKNDGLIHALRRYLNLEKIQNILYMEKVKLIEKYKQNIIFIQKNERRETVTKNQSQANEYLNKLKEKLGKDKFLKNINMEGLYEKLLKELTYRELDYILENPNKILNYIYINSKPLTEEPNSKTNRQINKEDEKNKQKEEEKINTEIKVTSTINKKEKKEKKEEEKTILSPRAIYNNLLDLVSEKKKERSKTKKQTINFKNMNFTNILNISKTEEKPPSGERKKEIKNSKVKKTPVSRSITLNKSRVNSYRVKKYIGSFHNSKTISSYDRQYKSKSSFGGASRKKVSEFRPIKDFKSTQINGDINLIEDNDINDLNNPIINNVITSKIIPKPKENEIKENKDIKENKHESEENTIQSITKKSNLKKKYSKKDTYIYEENISQYSQQKKSDKKLIEPKKNNNNQIKDINKRDSKINPFGIKPIKENKKEEYKINNKINNKEYMKKNFEQTIDKYKNKNKSVNKTNNNINIEKEKKFDVDKVKPRERKGTVIERKKLTYKELREKVFHKNNKTSVSTFY